MDNTQKVLIAAEIDQIIEAAYRAIMFEPIDKHTAINYRVMISIAMGKLKNEGIVKAYSLEVTAKHDKIEGWISFTPPNVVKEIVMNFDWGQNGLDIVNPNFRFDQAMKGV